MGLYSNFSSSCEKLCFTVLYSLFYYEKIDSRAPCAQADDKFLIFFTSASAHNHVSTIVLRAYHLEMNDYCTDSVSVSNYTSGIGELTASVLLFF